MMRHEMLGASRIGLLAAFLAVVLSACSIGSRAEALYFFQHRLLAALTSTIIAVEPDDPGRLCTTC